MDDYIKFVDLSKNEAILRFVRDNKHRIYYRVTFRGPNNYYSVDLSQFSDVIELLQVYDFGGFYYETES